MKKLLLGSVTLAVFSLSIVLFQISCKKDANAQTTTMTKDQILVAKSWRVDKVHHVIAGQYSSYTSGGSNSTGLNYDIMRFKFNSDGTGQNMQVNGTNYNFTWHFLSADNRSLQLTENGRTDTWDMLEIAGNYLHASVNLRLNGDSNNIETFRLIQVP